MATHPESSSASESRSVKGRTRPLLPYERASVRESGARELPHPTAAFPLMAPASAQGRPEDPAPRRDRRIDVLIAEAQAAFERMRARAVAAREALLEARAAPSGPARVRFVVPSEEQGQPGR